MHRTVQAAADLFRRPTDRRVLPYKGGVLAVVIEELPMPAPARAPLAIESADAETYRAGRALLVEVGK